MMKRALWGAVVCGLLVSGAAMARLAFVDVISANYAEPTDRYGHGILGDAIEFGALVMDVTGGRQVTVRLPETHVFEDVAPRIVDIDSDGMHEVMVVETEIARGARLAVYDGFGQLKAATPYIGRTHRWLAPIGAADLDGDGLIEVAYIDRPHLAKTLRIWRFVDGALQPVADLAGLTNHRIGEADIGGGLRDCDGVIEMITASADWTRVIATRLADNTLTTRDMGPHRGRASLNAAMTC
jgi:hypothetical protein